MHFLSDAATGQLKVNTTPKQHFACQQLSSSIVAVWCVPSKPSVSFAAIVAMKPSQTQAAQITFAKSGVSRNKKQTQNDGEHGHIIVLIEAGGGVQRHSGSNDQGAYLGG